MADQPNGIGSKQAGGLEQLRRTLGLETPRAAGSGAASAPGWTADRRPSGPKGMRILHPDTPLDQLDRRAPRGTYLDILV